MSPNLTRELADFVARTQFEDLPPRVQDRVKIILIDTVASAFAGGHSEEVGQIERMAIAVAGRGASPVVGRAPLSPAAAVLVNGYLVTAATVCDVHRPTLCHVTPQVFAPATAVAADRAVSGVEFLLAFALGLEMTTRIGLGSNYPAFRARGWHSPGVWGPFGGATAAGKLLGLDTDGLVTAFGLAGSQAAGTFAHWGTPTIKFHQSRGALSGYVAAQLAESGFDASDDVLTASDGGLYGTYSDGGDPAVATNRLGDIWELERLSLRPWPLASSLQSVATALLHLIESEELRLSDIASATVGLSPTVHDMHGSLPWNDPFHALLSAPYVAGVILADRTCWLEQFTPERIDDPDLDRFIREQVEVVVDESVVGTGAAVSLKLTDGRTVADSRAIPHGDAQDPLSMGDVSTKFLRAVGTRLGEHGAKQTLELLQTIESADRVTSSHFGALSSDGLPDIGRQE
jgi:2-methylcitrate dehydratase PrpD